MIPARPLLEAGSRGGRPRSSSLLPLPPGVPLPSPTFRAVEESHEVGAMRVPVGSPPGRCPSLCPSSPAAGPLLASPPHPLAPCQPPAQPPCGHCLCLSPLLLALCGLVGTAEASRLTWKMPRRCAPSRFLLEALAVSQLPLEHVHLCTPTFCSCSSLGVPLPR